MLNKLKRNWKANRDLLENITGIVLQKLPRGESGIVFKIFSKSEGIVAVYKRISQKKASFLPDYFDEVCFAVKQGREGSMLFGSDCEILARRTELAKNYSSYECASKLALCCVKNGSYLENFEALYHTFEAALRALAEGADYIACEIKFMYVFARNEGYAIREDFFANLDLKERELFKSVLLTPAKELNIDADECAKLLKKMNFWIAENTDIIAV